MTTRQPADRPARRPDIEHVDVEGELVLWDPYAQRVHRLDPVASLLWPFLDGTASIDDLAADVADVWETGHDEARRGIADLVAQLEQAGLLRSGTDDHRTRATRDEPAWVANPVRCGTDLSPWAWEPPTVVEVGGRTISFRTSAPDLAAGLRAALAAHVVAADVPVNYSLALGAGPGDLHILFWGHCTVARCRTVPEAVGALLAHLRGHGPIPDGAVRFDGHLLAAGDRAVLFPANERGPLWRVAARLRREGTRLVHAPWVDVDPRDATAVTAPDPLQVDAAALSRALGGLEPEEGPTAGELRVVGMYVPGWMDASSSAALATSIVQQGLLVDPPTGIARFAQLAPRLQVLRHLAEERAALTEGVRAALCLHQP